LPEARKYWAHAWLASRTLANVYVSAMTARQPSVPNWMVVGTSV
jgi:hypothetical protein